jgi:putative ABC transport system permease protein
MKRIFRHSQGRAGAARDVNDEIRLHLELRTKEFEEQGMSPDAARHAASAAFGDVTAIETEVRTLHAQNTRRRVHRDWIRGFLMDVSFALRTLRKNPGFTAAAIATLTLGIGATAAVFTVVNGVLLRPLPYADPGGLAMVWLSGSEADGLGPEVPISSGFYLDLKSQSKLLADAAAFRSWPYTVASDGPAEQVPAARVTPSLFNVLGVRPYIGSTFTDLDAQPGAAHVALISYSYWQQHFGGDRHVLGQRLMLSGEAFTVVGVMPPGFAFPRGAELPGGLQFSPRTELWTPMVFNPGDETNYGTMNLASVTRLTPGATREQAQGDLNVALHRFLKESNIKTKLDYRVVGVQQQAGGHVRRSLLVLMGAVSFVLLIACANVTNLLLARTGARQREFAVRAALGAGRGRIARQLVTENILLAAAGTALGLLVSVWGVRAMLALVPGAMPRVDDVSIDWRVIAAALAVAMAAGLAFGLATAWQLRWTQLAATLHTAGNRTTGGIRRRIGRRTLVIAEISLSVMLLIGAAELTRSFLRLQRVQPGFTPDHALTAAVQMPLPNGFRPAVDGPRWRTFFGQLMDRLNSTPGIVAAGAVSSLPLTGAEEGGAVTVVGRPTPASGFGLSTGYNLVSGRYFEAMGIRLLGGRTFDSRDANGGAPVIIVNKEFVHRYFADTNALGAQLNATFEFVPGKPRMIVGIVDNVQQLSLDAAPAPQVFVPEEQLSYPALWVVMRTRGDPATAAAPLRSAVKALDGTTAVAQLRPLDEVFADSLARQRFSTTIIIVFAGAALALAMVGLYGVIALNVGQRGREIGVRMALGARGGDVLRLLLGEGLRMAGLAIALGLAGALAMSRVLDTLLFGVTTSEGMVFVAAAVTVGFMSLVATWVPARRATRVDPTVTLRAD